MGPGGIWPQVSVQRCHGIEQLARLFNPLRKKYVANIARGRRQARGSRLEPRHSIDFPLVADRQLAFRVLGNKDCVAHPPARPLVLGLQFFPEPQSADFETRKLLLDLPPQASSSVSRGRLRPPGNIHKPSDRRLTRRTRPRLVATSLDDFAIPSYPAPAANRQSILAGTLPWREQAKTRARDFASDGIDSLDNRARKAPAQKLGPEHGALVCLALDKTRPSNLACSAKPRIIICWVMKH